MNSRKNINHLSSGDDRRKNLPSKVKKNSLFDKSSKAAETIQLRRSLRKSTIKNTNDTLTRQLREAIKQTRHHPTASSRAIEDTKAPLSAFINENKVKGLKENKEYKNGTFRIHFKGERTTETSSIFGSITKTSGSPLSGARISRSGWSSDQVNINQHLGNKLMESKGFEGAKNRTGYHGAEIAHLRAQHVGGLTDPLGAQSASWHSNVEDMAREEAQATLAKQFGDNVRIKSTAYIHESGDLAGTVKASRHKIYFRNNAGNWEKKFDHLQDGARGNINKSEAKALKEAVKNLSPSSPNVNLHGFFSKGIPKNSSVTTQKEFVPKSNNTASSPYFTDLRITSTTGRGTYKGSDAASVMKTFIGNAANMLSSKKK